jgi:hypothetical protein
MRLLRPLVLALFVMGWAHAARCQPTQADILEYTATTLLTNVGAAIHDAEKNGDEKSKSVYAKQYYAILYILWFSTKTDTPIADELLRSYFRAFNEHAEKFHTDTLIDRNDPLGIGALSPEAVSNARGMMVAGAYWDWVISKSENKQNYQRYVDEFNKQLESTK